MAKITLTTKYLDAVKAPAKTRIDIFDALTPGLNLRVTADKKSWSFVYTPPGSTTRARLSLGTYPATPLLDARQRATEARSKIEAGTDPRTVVAAEKPKTIAELAEERLALEVRGHQRRADEVEWRYKKYILPLIGNVAVQDFKIDPHYNKVIDPLRKRGKIRMAGVLHVDLSSLFDFAMRRGAIEFSRMAAAVNPHKYVPCERWMAADEIAKLWHSLPGALPKTPGTQLIIRLLLATGQRSNEVAGISRSEIDLEKALWTLPAARSKNGYEHVIPLNALAVALLREAMRKTNGEFLFPREDGQGSRGSNDVATAIDYARKVETKDALGKFGIAYWTPHDLRRTVGTHLSKLGVSDNDIGHVLNHRTTTKSTVTQQVYNQNTYINEKRAALDTWGMYLADLVGVQTGLRVVA